MNSTDCSNHEQADLSSDSSYPPLLDKATIQDAMQIALSELQQDAHLTHTSNNDD
ncbi:hypothetical protein ASPFODRAFT_46675 [Aspergillus luchuensis CBS 106.47]|uniref:Uncharacterized protein n=1 Tax=Aspergillus luchuensis (strain CBS 106.47) TaxID=1137211 RepID=A0A1M3TFW4_ASPLC|nr:hypothetical protein ASPFODRAFT_46675 [Aspergillus luchuensis CBS 106.47]